MVRKRKRPPRKAAPAAPSGTDLAAIRDRIDALDARLGELISERARMAQQVAVAKGRHGPADFYRPEREAQVLRGVASRNKGPLSNEEMVRLFREIMSACLAQEEPLKIGYLGPEGTFSQSAALKHFGQSIHSIPLRAIDEVFREVEAGSADYGVVPVENSTEGVVNHTLDMFLQSPLRICGEVQMRINHHLITCAADLQAVRRIYSHRQSLAQCREWLDANLPRVEQIEVGSNGEAARRVRDELDAAAIAGQCAADIYALPTLVRNIEDEPNNTTRFWVLGRQSVGASGHDQTSIVLSAPNRPGAVHELLGPLARHAVSMTRFESRPARTGSWEYLFYIDVSGHRDDPPVAAALDELRRAAPYLKLLGSYPVAREP